MKCNKTRLCLLAVGATVGISFLGSCTERRRAGDVEADGDTVRVVIPERHGEESAVVLGDT